MDDLIKRLENSDEGSRELDAEIARFIDELPRRYTRSIDAAVSLIPEGWTWLIHASRSAKGEDGKPMEYFGPTKYGAEVESADENIYSGRDRKNPALAVCIAALRARAGGV